MTNTSDELTLQQGADNAYFSGATDGARTRGVAMTRTRNYFVWNVPADMYNIERIEDSRGPNSVLFGIGSAGGIMNVSTKRPIAGRSFLRLTGLADDNGTQRGTIDVNQSLLRGRLGLRLNAVYSDRDDGQKLFAFQRNKAATLAASYALDAKTRLRGEYEGGRMNRVIARPNSAQDGFTIWLAQGKQLVSGTLNAAQQAAAGVSSFGANQRITYTEDNGKPAGAGVLLNNRNLYQSTGSGIGFPDETLVADEVNTGGPGQVGTFRFNFLMLTLERQFGEKTFLELAYNHQEQRMFNYKTYQQGSISNIRIDPNRTLADGTPNPYAGRLFTECQWSALSTARRDDDTRLAVTTELDFGQWGNYRLAGMAMHHWYVDQGGVLVEVWDGRPYGTNAEQAGNWVWRRSYFVEGDWSTYWVNSPATKPIVQMKDPATGSTLTSSWVSANQNWRDDPSYQDTILFGAQARYFRDRLVLGTGFRKDWLRVYDLQAVRDPATGAFAIDYGSKTAKPIDSRYNGVTKTLGAVYHLTKTVSLFYNVSSNFALPSTNQLIIPDAHTPGNTKNEGEDYGVAVELLDGRVYARATRYETHTRGGVSMFNGANSVTLLNNRILGGLLGAGAVTQAECDPHLLVPTARGFRGNRRDKVNLYTNYRFESGPLKGLSLGAGYRFQSKQNIGNYTDSTIQYGNSFWTSNATVGYRLGRLPRFLRMKSVGFQLNVDNATNNRTPIVRNRYINAPGTYGSLEEIFGVTIPAPRIWRLTANVEF